MQRNTKQKKLKKIEKKETKTRKEERKCCLLLTVSVENLTRGDTLISFDNLLCVLLTYLISQQKESAC